MASESIRDDQLATNIGKARKEITILFTDIVDSSRYWDMFGDVKGRMMVDRHNRLVFPVIKKYHGWVIKTIGDGLMAAFKHPHDALNAAIGIQQILQKMRIADRTFHAKVRLGLHTGMAIIEQNDIYGDAVNLAKRVESFGDANEIFLSEDTANLLGDRNYSFHKKGSFVPKGKSDPMTVYRCRWNEYKDLTRGLKVSSDLPLDAREKGDFVGYAVILVGVLVALYQIYGRFLLAALSGDEAADGNVLILNPLLVLTEFPFTLPLMLVVILAGILWLMWIKTASHILLRTLKGFMGFGLGFALAYLPVSYFEWDFATGPRQEIARTELLFSRVQYKDLPALAGVKDITNDTPNLYAFFRRDLIIAVNPESPLARQQNSKRQEDDKNRVIGIWTVKNLSYRQVQPFYFRFFDLCALTLGVLGFVSGFLNFTIRPS
jgi:class 3 adenylate cyclase